MQSTESRGELPSDVCIQVDSFKLFYNYLRREDKKLIQCASRAIKWFVAPQKKNMHSA